MSAALRHHTVTAAPYPSAAVPARRHLSGARRIRIGTTPVFAFHRRFSACGRRGTTVPGEVDATDRRDRGPCVERAETAAPPARVTRPLPVARLTVTWPSAYWPPRRRRRCRSRARFRSRPRGTRPANRPEWRDVRGRDRAVLIGEARVRRALLRQVQLSAVRLRGARDRTGDARGGAHLHQPERGNRPEHHRSYETLLHARPPSSSLSADCRGCGSPTASTMRSACRPACSKARATCSMESASARWRHVSSPDHDRARTYRTLVPPPSNASGPASGAATL